MFLMSEVQGYLAHEKTHPQGPYHTPTPKILRGSIVVRVCEPAFGVAVYRGTSLIKKRRFTGYLAQKKRCLQGYLAHKKTLSLGTGVPR